MNRFKNILYVLPKLSLSSYSRQVGIRKQELQSKILAHEQAALDRMRSLLDVVNVYDVPEAGFISLWVDQADLVVMGTVARTGIAGIIIGNTAELILSQLSCSVLAIKPRGFVSPVL